MDLRDLRALGLLGAVVAALAATTMVSATGGPPGRAAVMVGVVAIVALLLVHLHPGLMVMTVTSLMAWYWGAGYESGPALAAGPVALFLFGVVGSRRLLYLALIGFVTVVLGAAVAGRADVEFDEAASIVGPAAAAVFAADLVRQRSAKSQAEAEAARYRRSQEMVERQLALARDLHDGIGHSLTALYLQATVLERTIVEPAQAADAASAVVETSRTALADLNTLVRSLRQDSGTAEGRRELGDIASLADSGRRSGHAVTLRADLGRAEHAGERQEAAYRVVQESLTNATRHAPGCSIEIEVETSPQLSVRVQDFGSTADPADTAMGVGTGQGLAGMSERVAATGGRLRYGPTGSGGFEVVATWPT